MKWTRGKLFHEQALRGFQFRTHANGESASTCHQVPDAVLASSAKGDRPHRCRTTVAGPSFSSELWLRLALISPASERATEDVRERRESTPSKPLSRTTEIQTYADRMPRRIRPRGRIDSTLIPCVRYRQVLAASFPTRSVPRCCCIVVVPRRRRVFWPGIIPGCHTKPRPLPTTHIAGLCVFLTDGCFNSHCLSSGFWSIRRSPFTYGVAPYSYSAVRTDMEAGHQRAHVHVEPPHRNRTDAAALGDD